MAAHEKVAGAFSEKSPVGSWTRYMADLLQEMQSRPSDRELGPTGATREGMPETKIIAERLRSFRNHSVLIDIH